MQAWHYAWAVEAFRVLKPGGFLLAAGGDRTYHQLACAIEDAGFEMRGTVCHLFGQGFPKSLSIGKAIDKAAGLVRPRIPGGQSGANTILGARGVGEAISGEAISGEAISWNGWGTALKPAAEFWTLARKLLSESTVAGNVLKHGTGALNIDGCRIGGAWENTSAGQGAGHGTANADAVTYGKGLGGIVADPHPAGRWPANVILSHDERCERVGSRRIKGSETSKKFHAAYLGESATAFLRGVSHPGNQHADADGLETVESWWCVEGCPVSLLDSQAPGVSRFFYVAKAAAKERWAFCRYCDRALSPGEVKKHEHAGKSRSDFLVMHPTVKPIALMCYLLRLVTPPGGMVLDPFGGTGTTAEAASLEGFDTVLIERDPIYAAICRARTGT